MGVLGLDLTAAGRVTLMNQIGGALQIPPGGWHGQARLFQGRDVHLAALLQLMSIDRQAARIAENLARVGQLTTANAMLTLVTAAREHHQAVTATGNTMIDSFDQGGLDFLWDQRKKLGLPHAMTRGWQPARDRVNRESGHWVHPALIRARDQMVVYGAQIEASFRNAFMRSLADQFGDQADPAVARVSRVALIVWHAYAFLAPGGQRFDDDKPLARQLGQAFGIRSALGYIAWSARKLGVTPELDQILKDAALNHTEWVRSSKTRAAEALFLECLLKQAREVLPD